MLAQDQLVPRGAHGLGRNDLIGGGVLDHSVLVNARFMGECVPAHDRLVRLHVHAGDFRQELAGREQLLGNHRRFIRIVLRPDPHHHYQLFQGGISGPLADAVDGAFHLPRTGLDGCQRVCHGQSQIIVAVNRDGHTANSPHSAPQGLDQFREFVGHAEADGVRNVERRSTGLDHRLKHFTQEVDLGPAGVFSGELDVFAECTRQPYAVAGLFQALPP